MGDSSCPGLRDFPGLSLLLSELGKIMASQVSCGPRIYKTGWNRFREHLTAQLGKGRVCRGGVCMCWSPISQIPKYYPSAK
jgi:hypothetical protein